MGSARRRVHEHRIRSGKDLVGTAKTAATAVSPVLLSGDSLDEASLSDRLESPNLRWKWKTSWSWRHWTWNNSHPPVLRFMDRQSHTLWAPLALGWSLPDSYPKSYRCLVASGYIDLIDLLDATWSLGSGTLEQQVREYLQNARPITTDSDLMGSTIFRSI